MLVFHCSILLFIKYRKTLLDEDPQPAVCGEPSSVNFFVLNFSFSSASRNALLYAAQIFHAHLRLDSQVAG